MVRVKFVIIDGRQAEILVAMSDGVRRVEIEERGGRSGVRILSLGKRIVHERCAPFERVYAPRIVVACGESPFAGVHVTSQQIR